MSDDDDKRGSRDNTGNEHKPRQAQNYQNAPPSQLGTGRLKSPVPGVGGASGPRLDTRRTVKTTQTSEQTQQKDNRPVFTETGDKEVDAHHAKEERMIGKDSPEHPDNAGKKSVEGPKVSQSDFAKAFRRAHGQTRAMQQSCGMDHD